MAEKLSQGKMIEAIYEGMGAYARLDVDALNEFLTSQKERNIRFEKASKLVLGNGEPGLCESVRLLGRDMGYIKWIAGIALSAFVATIIGLWVTGAWTKLLS